MRTWGATTTVLPPAGLEGKHERFKGKYVNGKTVGHMTKITEFPCENGRVDRYGYDKELYVDWGFTCRMMMSTISV